MTPSRLRASLASTLPTRRKDVESLSGFNIQMAQNRLWSRPPVPVKKEGRRERPPPADRRRAPALAPQLSRRACENGRQKLQDVDAPDDDQLRVQNHAHAVGKVGYRQRDDARRGRARQAACSRRPAFSRKDSVIMTVPAAHVSEVTGKREMSLHCLEGRTAIRFRDRSGLECAIGFLYRAAFPEKPGQSPSEVRRKSQSCWVLK